MKGFTGKTAFCIFALICLWACTKADGGMTPSGGGMSLVTAPSYSYYGLPRGNGQATKASDAEGSGFDNLFIHQDKSVGNVRNLKPGSTLWLLIEVPSDDYVLPADIRQPSDITEPGSWKDSEYSYKPYIVGENGSMYPCETLDSTVTENGKTMVYRVLKRDELSGGILSSGSPLMLPSGLYRFHSVSPAKAMLISADGKPQVPTVHIYNGDYVLATDVRWKETYPKGVYIQGGTSASGTQRISLAALVNQTARLKINIHCGDENVKMISLLDSGIEISGIQEDGDADFKWTQDGEPIKTKIGSKYEAILLGEYEEGKKDMYGKDMITGYASILPTDARTNSIYITFHLMVNNVPSQYMVGLTNQLYEAAHQYEFNFRLTMDGNITVGTWDNASQIINDLELDPDDSTKI